MNYKGVDVKHSFAFDVYDSSGKRSAHFKKIEEDLKNERKEEAKSFSINKILYDATGLGQNPEDDEDTESEIDGK